MVIPLDESFDNQTWIIGNINYAGFYRVNYDERNWNLLINQLQTNHSMIDSATKAQLIDDAFNLGRAEIISQVKFMDIISYLRNEGDPLPFQAAMVGLDYLSDMFSNDYISHQVFKVGSFFICENINYFFKTL